MKVSLLGYMGSGKSTIARLLAQKTGLKHIDLDSEIEKQSGHSITETIFNKGELYFRQLEREKLEGILLNESNFILSTGGGTPCYYDNIELLNKYSTSIFLHLGISELYARLEGSQAERPLIAHLEGPTLNEFIAKHLFERLPYYDKAVVNIKTTGKTTEEILNQILQIINE